MFRSYILIASRNLLRHRTFSLLNILGLALSMSVCLLIIMLIRDAYGFDRFHPEDDRIYRVITEAQRKDGRHETYASSPYPVGTALAGQSPHVELRTAFIRRTLHVNQEHGEAIPMSVFFTDPDFFKIFGYTLSEGDPATALNEPYAIVLSDVLATAIFDKEEPIGQTITISGYDTEFNVTGVLAAFPGKTHMEFTALISQATEVARERTPNATRITDNWQNYYSTYNFIRINSNKNKAQVENTLAHIAEHSYAGLTLESRDAGYQFELQQLSDITPGPNMSNSMGEGMPRFLILFFTMLGIIIILCACFNYTNLTIARALTRTREVGVRKVLGAGRMQIFWQFIGEAMLTALVALAIGYLLMKWVRPQFERLSFTEFLDIRMTEDATLYLIFIGFALIAGLIAGMIPALTMSRTKPVTVLQKLQDIRLIKRFGLRKVLLTTQFAFTLIFLIVMTVSWRQVGHAITTNFGFDKPNTLIVRLQEQPWDRVATALTQVSGVTRSSAISHTMGTWQDASSDVRIQASDEKREVRDYAIDHQYLAHFDIALVAGENFPENPAQQQERAVIVNETFVRHFQLGDPGDAVGRQIILDDSTYVSILGVVRDFPFKPATYAMEPLLLRYRPELISVINLEIAGRDAATTVAGLESAWKNLETGRPFRAEFFDATVRDNYSNMLDLTKIVGFFGLLGMVIACMGLLGMAIYTVESKAKEISIRKVLGARVKDVIFYLSKGYALLFLIAIAIATPVAFLLSNKFLEFFAERISWGPGLFLPGILLLLTSAAITIGWQLFRAASADPVNSLRSE